MNLILFIFTIVVSFIAVRIGAIAFELTGLEGSLARFQALSCFTRTGFTTREAELITGNTQRRKIAAFLMILGNAGFVTLIATFANSLRPSNLPRFTIPFLRLVFPSYLLPWINLITITLFLYVSYKIFTHAKITEKLTRYIRARIIKKDMVKRVSFEELVVSTGGYGVTQIEICENSPMLEKMLMESNLRKEDITVLAIERKGLTIPNPPARTKILLEDKLICFGKLGTMREKICIM